MFRWRSRGVKGPGRVAEEAAQDLLVVLAHLGGEPTTAVGNLDHGPPLPGMRIPGRLRDGIHRRRAHVVAREVV